MTTGTAGQGPFTPGVSLPDNRERQVATSLDGIRADHVARYEFAARYLRSVSEQRYNGEPIGVLDLGCGVGYGSAVLAHAGLDVVAFDRDAAAIAYAKEHWMVAGPASTHFGQRNLSQPFLVDDDSIKAAVAFEIVEHLENPVPMLATIGGDRLLVSVPNELAFPFENYAFHHRHYTPDQFQNLLNLTGWHVLERYGQLSADSHVMSGSQVDINRCRTLVYTCERYANWFEDGNHLAALGKRAAATNLEPAAPAWQHPTGREPECVMLCGLGPSKYQLIEMMVQHDFTPPWQELWTVNKGIAILPNADVAFIMDDIYDYARRHPAYAKEMAEFRGEIIGQTYFHEQLADLDIAYQDFPLNEVLRFWSASGHAQNWLHTISLGYILAYAGAIGVKRLMLAGIDCSWPGRPDLTEAGNAVVCYWLGRLEGAGCEVIINSESALNATNQRGRYEWRELYGYLMPPDLSD